MRFFFAVSNLCAFDRDANESTLREAEIAKTVLHINLLQCIDYRKVDNLQRYPHKIRKLLQQKFEENAPLHYFHIHMEYCNGGSLQDWIVSLENPDRNLQTADSLFLQLLKGVAELHKSGIVHGDLKPQNILLHKVKDNIIVKVGDFGDSFYENGPHRKEFGTPMYKVKSKGNNEEHISTKCDIGSLGLIYCILFMASFLNFDKNLVCNDEIRENALHNLLNLMNNAGSSKLMQKTHPNREKFVRQLIADEGRPDAYHTIEDFSRIVEITNFSMMSSSVPGKNPLFQGRQNILQQIKESSSMYILLYGLTGTGKKTIAAEFLHSKTESNEFQETLWFDCSSEKTLKKQYRDLQAEKKLKGQSGRETLNWLNSTPRLAIVYENVHNFSKIQDLLAIKRSNGVVICTSRINSDDFPEYFNKIKVDLLPENDCSYLIHEAVTIISNQNKIPTKKEIAEFNSACRFLSLHMGYSTTAIPQSLVYLRTRTNSVNISSICKYVEDCRQGNCEVEQMQHDVIKLAKLETTLLPTISQLSSVSSMAFKWLKMCAYLDCQNIPEFVFDNFLEKNQAIQLKPEILDHLKSCSLLEYDSSNNGSFSVSRIVQKAIQMYFGSSFKDTIQNISTSLSIRHLNGKGTTKTYNDAVYKVRTLQPHYESIISYVSEYNNTLTSRMPYHLNCCNQPKKDQKLEKIQFSVQKSLRHSYKSQSLHEKEKTTLDEILTLKESLYGNNSLICGTTLMARAKLMLSSATASKCSNINVETITDMFSEAEKILEKCYNQNPSHIEIAQCYLYQAHCCELPKSQRRKLKGDKEKIEERRVERMENKEMARRYLNKALNILVEALNRKRNVLCSICTTLKRIAENYSYFGEWELMEKYLLIAFEFGLLKNVDDVDDKLKMLQEIDNYNVTDELFENTLNKWICNPSGAKDLLKTFSRCYERRQNSSRANFVAEIHEKCNLKASTLKGAFLPNFEKLLKQEPTEKLSATILEGLESLKEKKKENPKNVALATAQNKVRLAELSKRKKENKEAIQYFNEGLDIFLQQKNANDLSIAFIYEHLGECYSDYNDREKACEMFEKCYRIFKSNQVFKQEKNIKFANIIQKYAKKLPVEQIEEKISLLEECLQILISYFPYSGSRHNEVAFVKEKIGSLYLKMENCWQAKKLLKEALQIYEEKLPQGNQNRISCLEKLYKACEKLLVRRYKGDDAEKYKIQYEEETTIRQVNGNNCEKSVMLLKTKRKKIIRNEKRAKSINQGKFR